MNIYSNCCGAKPYLNNELLERCSRCKENCTFERRKSLRVLNYKHVLKKVVKENYSPFKFYMLNMDQKIDAVTKAHTIMREYVLAQKR
jgi:hypothetical protein